MQPRAVSHGPQPLLQILLSFVTLTHGSVVRPRGSIQAEKEMELGKRAVDEVEMEIEGWDEAELLKMSAKFSSRHIRRVKRDDGYDSLFNIFFSYILELKQPLDV